MKLNLGLTFYGGVSLAVYEAGVAEEFLRFIEFCGSGWRKEFKGEKPDVQIKVISGTSAGGLAAILMAAALVNSKDPSRHITEMRRIWFNVADLSRIQYKRGENIRSLLNNNILEEEVEKFLKISEGNGESCDKLNILVTGTNMQGYFDAIPVEHDFTDNDASAERVFPTTRHTEVFSFTGADFRNAVSDQGGDVRRRISKAARITSSFPAAFPPQFVQSPSFSDKTVTWYGKNGKDNGHPMHFWYFDGGVLDNKPLGHAIDHMQKSMEEGDWWYFFIEPKPQDYEKKHQAWGTDSQSPPDPSAAVLSVFEARGAETIYYDLRRIQKINHQVMQINSLVPRICSLLYSASVLTNEVLKSCEDSLRTARLHRFLPDYLKCITMIRYAFVRKGKLDEEKLLEIEKKDKFVLYALHPLELPVIIAEVARTERFIKDLPDELRGKMKNDHKLIDSLQGYEFAADEVREAQLLFRQVAFWVELEYQQKQMLGEDTWKCFVEAMDGLVASLENLGKTYALIEWRIRELCNDDGLFAMLKSFALLNEAVHAAAGVETRQPITVVKIYHNAKKYGGLAGSQLANFSGFLDRKWRRHDYLMGIKDTREMLAGRMKCVVSDDLFWKDYDLWRGHKDAEINSQDKGAVFSLSDSDVLNPEQIRLDSLPAEMAILQVNSILKTAGTLINKYQDRTFFYLLKKGRVNWLLPPVRFMLWILREAAVQPRINKEGTECLPETLRGFLRRGRNSIGFMLIGMLLGLLISFFLPDFIGDFVRRIWVWLAAIFR